MQINKFFNIIHKSIEIIYKNTIFVNGYNLWWLTQYHSPKYRSTFRDLNWNETQTILITGLSLQQRCSEH
jgi:hypothetical protein